MDTRQRFPLGRILATPGALDGNAQADTDPLGLIRRHQRGDFGSIPPEDAAANLLALAIGERVISSYVLPGTDQRIWIISEADRSATTLLLLPEAY
jgi:hypothetical protein